LEIEELYRDCRRNPLPSSLIVRGAFLSFGENKFGLTTAGMLAEDKEQLGLS
jgi:hypothetical protein